jgi:hypothetical protein
MRITKRIFLEKTGFLPEQNDLERANCKRAGETIHIFCGWCEKHDKPRVVCRCFAPWKSNKVAK